MSNSSSSTPPPPPPAAAAGDSLDIGRCFDDAIRVYRANFWPLVLAAIVFEACSVFTLFILAGPLFGGVCLMTMSAISRPDSRIEFGLMFSRMGQFGRLLGLFFLTLVAVLFALMLLVIPGVLLSAMWLFPFHFAVDLDLTVGAALTASWRTVRRNFGPNLLLTIIVIALAVLPSLIPFIGMVLGWFLAPLTWLLMSSAYLQQVRGREEELGDLGGRGFQVETARVAPPAR